jgi:hypothetical protein
MTQTPASGPLGPRTMPPMSSASITTSLPVCCALRAGAAPRPSARALSGTDHSSPGRQADRARRCPLPLSASSRQGRCTGDARLGCASCALLPLLDAHHRPGAEDRSQGAAYKSCRLQTSAGSFWQKSAALRPDDPVAEPCRRRPSGAPLRRRRGLADPGRLPRAHTQVCPCWPRRARQAG